MVPGLLLRYILGICTDSFLFELFEREVWVCNALYWESFDPLLLLYADPLELLREYAEPLELLRLLSVESGLVSCLGL